MCLCRSLYLKMSLIFIAYSIMRLFNFDRIFNEIGDSLIKKQSLIGFSIFEICFLSILRLMI